MTYTKGPWHYEWDADGDHAIFAGSGIPLIAVTNGYLGDLDREEDEANARLIAQSPALLAALKALYEETADYIRINNLGDVHHNHSMQMAREAILAAEGSDRP